MASKKLAQAIVSGNIKVKNVSTGEVKLNIEGKDLCLCHNQVLDIGKRIKKPKDAMAIRGLNDLLKAKNLVLVD